MKIKAQTKVDEFAFILLGAVIFITILSIAWIKTPSEITYVYPQKLVFHLSPGDHGSKTIIINGSGVMSATPKGEIASWITPQYTSFTVDGGGSFSVSVNVPSDASIGSYEGSLVISSNESEKVVKIIVFVENVTKTKERVIPLADFSISYVGSSKEIYRKTDVSISDDTKFTAVIQFDELQLKHISSLKAKIVIDDTNNAGKLEVLLNGIPVYVGKVSEGEIEIPLNVSILKDTNVITFKTVKDTWKFWEKPYYHFYSITLVAKYNSISKDFNFKLSREEIDNFKYFELSALVKPTTPVPILKIKINNQLVYLDRIPLSGINLTFSRDLLGNSLILNEDNTLSLSLASEGSISFSNVLFKVITRE